MRSFIIISLLFIICSFACAAEDQKVLNDDSKDSQNAYLSWKRTDLIGYTYKLAKNKNDKTETLYTFSDKDVYVALTIQNPKSDALAAPLVGPLHWSIDDKGVLNIDGAPVFKWTASWKKVEEHDNKVVVINKKGEKETYFRAKINTDSL